MRSFPAPELVDSATAERALEFPYVPGLLAFREIPAIRGAFAKLRFRSRLVFVDGHGYARPRRFGIACMLGVELDVPVIGIGKSRLIGSHRAPERPAFDAQGVPRYRLPEPIRPAHMLAGRAKRPPRRPNVRKRAMRPDS